MEFVPDWRSIVTAIVDDLNVVVSGIVVGILTVLILMLWAFQQWTVSRFLAIETVLLEGIGLGFAVTLVFTVLVVGYVGLSSVGDIVLGGPDAERTYDSVTYFSVLFTAGIAAGIVFFGPAEGVLHYTHFWEIPGRPAAIDTESGAIGYTLINWGIITWCTYAIITLPAAYFCYCHDAPFRVSSCVYPLVQDRQPIAQTIDGIAIVGIVLGFSTSTASVVDNFLQGISFQWGVTFTESSVIILVLAVAMVFTISTTTGLHRGIRRLALLTMGLFGIVTVGVFVLGPTGTIVRLAGTTSIGQPLHYGSLVTVLDEPWGAAWPIFYWAVWFAWAPAVGLFVARISRGRTIRAVIGYSIAATGLATMVWFVVVGGTAVHLEATGQVAILEAIGTAGPEVAGYPVFVSLPAGELFLLLLLALGITFLVTSADSALFAVSMTAAERSISPPTAVRLLWGITLAIVTCVLILFGGSDGHQAFAVSAGGLFAGFGTIALVVFLGTLYTKGGDHATDTNRGGAD